MGNAVVFVGGRRGVMTAGYSRASEREWSTWGKMSTRTKELVVLSLHLFSMLEIISEENVTKIK